VPAGSNRTLQPTDISGALTKPGDSISMSEIPNEDSFMMGDSIFQPSIGQHGSRTRKASQQPMNTSRNQGQHVTHLPSLNQMATPSLKFAISGKPASIHSGTHHNSVIGSSVTPNRHAVNTIQKKRFHDELDGIPAT